MVVEDGATVAVDETAISVSVGLFLISAEASRLYSAVLELVKRVATEETSKVRRP